MNGRAFFLMFGLVCLLFCTIGCGKADVDKAKEFMAAGMYPQARELLDKRIQEKPDDAEAHYTLGICLLSTGDFQGADQRFASAVRLKPDYGFQIGGAYKKAGIEALEKNGGATAIGYFDKALAYQPDLKSEIAGLCLKKGTDLMNQGSVEDSIKQLHAAANYDAGLKLEIAELCMNKGKELLEQSTQNADSSTSETL